MNKTIKVIGFTNSIKEAAIILAIAGKNNDLIFCDEPVPIKITAPPDFELKFSCDTHRKSKGEKRRNRSERRRKWGI
jgi:hypothetical protein